MPKTEKSKIEVKLTKIMILITDRISDFWYEYPLAGVLSHDPSKGTNINNIFLSNKGVKWSDWDHHVTKVISLKQHELFKHVFGDMDSLTTQRIFNLSNDILLPIRNENLHLSSVSPTTIDVNFVLKLATFLREISFNFSSKSVTSTHYLKELLHTESPRFVEFTSCMAVSFPFTETNLVTHADSVTQANIDSSSYEVGYLERNTNENIRNFASAAFASSKVICSLYHSYLVSTSHLGGSTSSGRGSESSNIYNAFLQSLQCLLDPFQQQTLSLSDTAVD